MNKQVLATVGGREITMDDLNMALMSAPKEHVNQLNTPIGKQRLLEELITQEIVYLDAKEKGLDEEDEFLTGLERAKEHLLKQYAIKKVIENIKVEENEAKKYYEENSQQFVAKEKIRASHILVKDEESANNILKEIQNGKAFEEAATEHSECPSKAQGGDLGYFERGQMVPEFENAAFQLEIGKVSEPVKTQFGYHLIRVEDKKTAEPIPFEQVQNQIQKYLLGNKQNNIFKEYTDKLKSKYEITKNEELIK